MTLWAILPVKPLRDGKSRLAGVMPAADRAALNARLLQHAVSTLRATTEVTKTLVVSRDPGALKLARECGAVTLDEGSRHGLNMAVMRAVHIAVAHYAAQVLVMPVDLPFVTSDDVSSFLACAPVGSGCVVCPDNAEDGTNALYVAPPAGFRFQYGVGSFTRHQHEAVRLGLPLTIVRKPSLQFDLDTEADWSLFQARTVAQRLTIPPVL